jgi:diamine N-acetyltransferase
MKLLGPRVTVRPTKRQDLDAMARWRPLTDPLYQPFDFPRRPLSEHVDWFNWRKRDPSRRLYTVMNEGGQPIGSLTLREIDGKESSRLGITLGSDYVGQGYGTEALRLFLEYYFETMGFARMLLDVSATNLRAVRSYRALGFQEESKHFRPAGHPSFKVLRTEPRYQHLRPFFRRLGTMYQVLFYDMALTREEWRARNERDPAGSGDWWR